MSLGEELLNELCFTIAQLPVSNRTTPPGKLSTKCSLVVSGSGREHQFSLPYFVRHLSPTELGISWVPFCSLLRQHGIPIFSSVRALQDVPAASVPARWGLRFINEPIDAVELTTADAFELSCRNRSGEEWGWSSELHPEKLGALVCAVREAAGGDTPIGVCLPLGAHQDDVRQVLAANVDFIGLIARYPRLEAGDVQGLVHCRRMADQLRQSSLPILVSAPITNQEQAHKLLALGATAVCIDDLLRPLISEALAARTTALGGAGMLSGMMPVTSPKTPALTTISTALVKLQQQLVERMNSAGASDMRKFTSQLLRSCSQRAQQVTGVAPLLGTT